MTPAVVTDQAPIPPPSYHRKIAYALHLDALTLVTHLHLLTLCRVAVQMAQRRCPPPLPAGPGGAPHTYREESLPHKYRFLQFQPTKQRIGDDQPPFASVCTPVVAHAGAAWPDRADAWEA